MTDIIKLAYEQGQMQAMADLGLIKDAGLVDKVRDVASGLFGKAKKGLQKSAPNSASRDQWVRLDSQLGTMSSELRRGVQRQLKGMPPSERESYIKFLENDGHPGYYNKFKAREARKASKESTSTSPQS